MSMMNLLRQVSMNNRKKKNMRLKKQNRKLKVSKNQLHLINIQTHFKLQTLKASLNLFKRLWKVLIHLMRKKRKRMIRKLSMTVTDTKFTINLKK